MKYILVLILSMTSFSSFADTSITKEPCLKQALSLVSSLEQVWMDINGPIQGDNLEEELSHTLVKITDKAVTYKVSAYHVNEDEEAWENNYQVTLNKEWCSMEEYSFLGYTDIKDEVACIDKEAAKVSLKEFFRGNYNTTPLDWFFWLDEENEDHFFTEATAEKALSTLYWNTTNQEYETDVIFDGYCAAGAQCWGGFRVNCDGDTDIWYDGED